MPNKSLNLVKLSIEDRVISLSILMTLFRIGLGAIFGIPNFIDITAILVIVMLLNRRYLRRGEFSTFGCVLVCTARVIVGILLILFVLVLNNGDGQSHICPSPVEPSKI